MDMYIEPLCLLSFPLCIYAIKREGGDDWYSNQIGLWTLGKIQVSAPLQLGENVIVKWAKTSNNKKRSNSYFFSPLFSFSFVLHYTLTPVFDSL